jgi:hypothetical protein
MASMVSSNLMLHAGGKLVTLDELGQFKAPPPEGRWFPVPHAQVRNRVVETLEAAGYQVKKEQLAVAKAGTRFFGVLDLATPVSGGDITLAVAVRNSVDRSFPLGFCAGSRVFCCDNLAFRAELLIRRKHTRFGEQRFNQAIAEAVSGLSSFRDEEGRRIEVLRQTELPEVLAESLLLRAYERGVIGAHQLPLVLKEWRQPRFEEFRSRTAWSLFNAVTTVLGEQQRHIKQPQAFVAQTMQLHHLLEFKRGETDVPQAQTAS